MDVSVIIPFSSDDPARTRARDHVAAWWSSVGFDVTFGECDPPWRKAIAVGDAVRHTTGQVLVVADADVIVGDWVAVGEAIGAVWGGAGWAMPHGQVHRLDEEATAAVYAGAPPRETVGRTQRPYRGWPGGGVAVVSRATWNRIPMDPRFAGWGGEDESWARALDMLAGPCARGAADLYHLHHPPAHRMSRRWGTHQSRALAGRYRAANTVAAMDRLVAEARDALEVAV